MMDLGHLRGPISAELPSPSDPSVEGNGSHCLYYLGLVYQGNGACDRLRGEGALPRSPWSASSLPSTSALCDHYQGHP